MTGRFAACAAVLFAALLVAACGPPLRPTPEKKTQLPPPREAVDPGRVPDAVPRAEPRSPRGNPPFYEVFGQRYFVLPTAEGHVERGVASWYGPGFHSVATAMGETYDMYAMTAAHRTLPIPCYARVTNLANGRSVVVRINDRGPFVGNRIIDLSLAAATRLDMVEAGTAMVEVRVVTPESARAAPLAPPAAARTDALYVQAGAFAEAANAERLVSRLAAGGIANASVRATDSAGRRLHRVRVGPVRDVAEFDALVTRLATLGISDARLALD